MGSGETMIDLGKVEAGRLREAINDLLAKIANGAIPRDGATSMEVARLIDSAEKQIADIERKDESGREKEREEALRELAIAYKVEQEAALNAEEKRQYGEFLKKEYFTKDDFSSLEQFYTNSYDKLTDNGKAEMSTRVWEGVRQKEYEFIELPDIVKEKEALRLHHVFSASRELPSELKRIPQNDREDFVREWSAGNKAESFQVLNRSSFAENVSLSEKSVVAVDSKVGTRALAASVLAEESEQKSAPQPTTGSAGATEIQLDDVLLISNDCAKVEAPLPGGKSGSLVKGG